MQNEIQVQNELIPVDKINVPQLFTTREMVDGLLDAIAKKAREHDPDLSTDKSRKEIASNAYKVAQSKTFLDGLGKDFVAAQKAEIKVTDENRKLIRDTLDALRDEVRKPLTDYEEAEKERIAKEKAEAEYQTAWEDALHENDLFDRQREIERKEAELRRQEEERKAKEEAERIERERAERENRIAEEAAERARQEEAAKAKLAQEKAEREKRAAEERAKQAELEKEIAEQRRIKDAELAEQRRAQAIKDAEAKAKRDAEERERQRLAKEAEERKEAERKAKHHAHRKSVNNAALACFEKNGIETEIAKRIITMISEGLIDHVTINY